jgi:hypothetical protein
MTIPKRHRPLSAGALQSPTRPAITFAKGPTHMGYTIELILLDRIVSVTAAPGESVASVNSRLRAAVNASYEVTP